MNELLLSSTWNWINTPTGSEYALMYMSMSNCARILNLPESAKIYPNVGKYTSFCLTLYDWIYLKHNVPK